ncbi:hypothetical protein B0H19DRAFT_1259028 [Mycena capillaripes]|nr:hypothetical protein B0H19DRAFT_1259028 [Mycena capillaripes]
MTSAETLLQPPVLPPELEQEIFITAATMHEEAIPTLLLVAHRVLVWIEPLLYRTLIFRKTRHYKSRLSAAIQIIQTKPPAVIPKNVHDVMVWHPNSKHEICTLLSMCSGVQNVVLHSLTPATVLCLSSLQRLQRLTLPEPLRSEVPQIHPSMPFFLALTHLHIHTFVGHLNRQWIGALPSLTHFCIEQPLDVDLPDLLGVLQECTKLRILVCTYPLDSLSGGILRNPTAWIDDHRVVLLALDVETDAYVQDWRSGAAGGRDFWVRAEEFLAKKQKDPSITTQACDYRVEM